MHLVCTTSALIYYQSFTNGVHPMCAASALCVTLSSVSTVHREKMLGMKNHFDIRDTRSRHSGSRLYKHKSYKETRVFFSLFPLTSLMFNSCDSSVQVSFIPGYHRLMPVLVDYPSLSCCRFFRDYQTKYTGYHTCI